MNKKLVWILGILLSVLAVSAVCSLISFSYNRENLGMIFLNTAVYILLFIILSAAIYYCFSDNRAKEKRETEIENMKQTITEMEAEVKKLKGE